MSRSLTLRSYVVLIIVVVSLTSPTKIQAQDSMSVSIQYRFTDDDKSVLYLESNLRPAELAPTISYEDTTTSIGGKWSFNSRVWYSYIQLAKCSQIFHFSMQGSPTIEPVNLSHLDGDSFIINDYYCPPVVRAVAAYEVAPGQNIAIYGFKFIEGYTGSQPDTDFQVCFEGQNGQTTCSNGSSIQYWKNNSVRTKLPTSLQPGQNYIITVRRDDVESQGKLYRVGANTFPEGSNRMIIGYDGPDTNRVYALTSTKPLAPSGLTISIDGQAHYDSWKFDGIDWFAHEVINYCNRDLVIGLPSPAVDQVFRSNISNISGNRFRIEPESCQPYINTTYPQSGISGGKIGLTGNNFLNGRTSTDDSELMIEITSPSGELTTITKIESRVWYDTYIGEFTLPLNPWPHTYYQLVVIRDGIASRPISLLINPHQTFLPALSR